MQKSASGKKKPKIVRKPMLQGSFHDKTGRKRAFRVSGAVLVSGFVYLVFGSMLVMDSLILRILFNTLLIAMCAGFLYMTGARHGEADAAYAEIMFQRSQEGKELADADRARCFHPLKGTYTALLGALPFVLLAIPAAITAKASTYTLGVLPSWLTIYQRQPEIGNALSYYAATSSTGILDYLQIVDRLLVLPFVTMVGNGDASAVLLIQRLSPLLVLFVPAGYALGYLQGKELRARVHTSIAQSARKKKRKETKERQKRQQKGPEQLI